MLNITENIHLTSDMKHLTSDIIMLIIKTCSELAELSNKSVVQTIGKKTICPAQDLGFGIWDLGFRIWDLRLRGRNRKARRVRKLKKYQVLGKYL